MRHAASAYADERALTARERWVSLLEVLLGAFIVIGHNVFRILPNEVPILLVLLFISLRLRDGRWTVAGLQRPKSWPKTVVIAVGAAAVLQIGSELVIQPLGSYLWNRPEHASSVLTTSALSWKLALRNLAIVWSFAAFGEELSYRRLSSYACCGPGRSLKDCLRHRNGLRRTPVRVRAFLQGSCRSVGLHLFGSGSRKRLFAHRPQPVGFDSDARNK
jgi:hypothetical protein